MQPQTDGEYQKLLTDVIKKQIIILGPTITIAKARNVPGLTVQDDGTVTAISGNPQEITQHLIEQFMELSGLIVKKTMEPLLASYPGLAVTTQVKQEADNHIIQNNGQQPSTQPAPAQPASTATNQSGPASPTPAPTPIETAQSSVQKVIPPLSSSTSPSPIPQPSLDGQPNSGGTQQ